MQRPHPVLCGGSHEALRIILVLLPGGVAAQKAVDVAQMHQEVAEVALGQAPSTMNQIYSSSVAQTSSAQKRTATVALDGKRAPGLDMCLRQLAMGDFPAAWAPSSRQTANEAFRLQRLPSLQHNFRLTAREHELHWQGQHQHLHPGLLVEMRNVELLTGRMWQQLVMLLDNLVDALQLHTGSVSAMNTSGQCVRCITMQVDHCMLHIGALTPGANDWPLKRFANSSS